MATAKLDSHEISVYYAIVTFNSSTVIKIISYNVKSPSKSNKNTWLNVAAVRNQQAMKKVYVQPATAGRLNVNRTYILVYTCFLVINSFRFYIKVNEKQKEYKSQTVAVKLRA